MNKYNYKYYEIKKSKFYSYKFDVNNLKEFEQYFSELKSIHPKAKHICYAYKIVEDGQKVKVSDDNEPKGVAGYPILKLIENKNLNNIVIFVVRYFGGTKLGSGLLLRSYLNAANLILKD